MRSGAENPLVGCCSRNPTEKGGQSTWRVETFVFFADMAWVGTYDELSGLIIGAAIEVHRELGPGLLESIYEHCLELELKALGLEVKRQELAQVVYKGVALDLGFRIDLMVEDKVIVELKATDAMHDVHYAQLLSYLKLLDCKLGLLINFNQETLVKGVKRMANGLDEP